MQVPEALMRWKKFETGVANKDVVDKVIHDIKSAKKNKKNNKPFLTDKEIGELYELTEQDVIKINKAKQDADDLEINGFLLSGNTFTFEDGSVGRNYSRAGVLMVEAIEEAYEELGFRVPITGEYLSGTSWGSCH